MLKKLFILTAALTLLPLTASAGGRLIPFDELPGEAKKFVKTYFSDLKVLQVEKEFNEYEVKLTDYVSLEFDPDGNWKQIKCRRSAVPDAIIPTLILSYVKENFPGSAVVQIERSKWGYELELDGELELEFDRNCNFVRIDD